MGTHSRNFLNILPCKSLKFKWDIPIPQPPPNLPFSEYFFVNSSEEQWIGDFHVKEGEPVSTPDLAVNWKMIRNIYKMMAEVNQNSDSSV